MPISHGLRMRVQELSEDNGSTNEQQCSDEVDSEDISIQRQQTL